MSNSSQHPDQSSHSPTIPRAVIHKKILNAAESHPSATSSELAAKVSGASEELVERVFEEYGDPADNGDVPDSTDQSSEPGNTGQTQSQIEDSDVVDDVDGGDDSPKSLPSELTDKQYETLQAIAANPEATQRELGKVLEISGATVNSRVNKIDGFEWETRAEFVSNFFGEDMMANESTRIPDSTVDASGRIEELTNRMASIERRLEEQRDADQCVVTDPELVHKIIHACISSDHISEREEMRIIKEVINNNHK